MFLAPTGKEEMIEPLKRVVDAGIPLVTVDTFIGDGDYANGDVTFPMSYIGSNNVEGGMIAARALAESLDGKGKVLGLSAVSPRDKRCEYSPPPPGYVGFRVIEEK